jgi:hypothetical protein
MGEDTVRKTDLFTLVCLLALVTIATVSIIKVDCILNSFSTRLYASDSSLIPQAARDESAMGASTVLAVINPITHDSNFKFSNLTVGTKFLANVTIADVTRLSGWQINITYDPTLLSISNQADIFLPSNHIFNGLDPRATAKTINNTAGYVMWACAIGPSAPKDNFNGSGVMCQIFFTVIKIPSEGEKLSCNLVLDRLGTFPTSIVDPYADDIPFTEQNGYYELSSGLIHDLAVTDVEPFKTVIGQGDLSINVTVENQGNFAETFNLTVYCSSTPIATMMDISLTSHTNITITFIWNITDFAKGNYTLWAYAQPVQNEKETTNNTFTDGWVVVTIPGDINGDFKVDIKDLVLVIKHYASYPSHPMWNPNADINGDLKVDIKDLVLVIKHYGEHYP